MTPRERLSVACREARSGNLPTIRLFSEDIEEVLSAIDAAEQEVERLRAVVENLPPDADGVRLYPTAERWTQSGRHVRVAAVYDCFDVVLVEGVSNDNADMWEECVEDLHSSRAAAAEAAGGGE